MTEGAPLVLVSNRGPVTHQDDGSIKRGTGGLVTALTGLASHRDAVWIASALTDGDKRRARKSGGEPFVVHTPEGGEFHVRLVVSDDQAYDRFYNVFANPMLWFIQHYLWDLSNAPDIRRHEVEAFEYGYNVVNDDLAEAVVEEIEGVDEPVVMVHDYHLYTLPGLVRRARPDVFLHHFVHIPWTQPDAWRVLPTRIRREIYEGLLANDIIGFHTRSYRWNFLQCCRDLMDLDVDFDDGHRPRARRSRGLGARLPAADRLQGDPAGRPLRAHEGARGASCSARRREYLMLRVDRADLSKNVLRGFTAFDLFLEQHPEFRERVTFIAQLMPSRTDVPEYAEYLERIEALVAVVNHRHGTPDWMPIQLKLRDDLEEAMASYKHYDVLLVNAMFDGMNLVAKEGPLVNERNGVSDPLREHRSARGARRVRPVGEPLRHPGDRRLDPRRAHDERRGARAQGRPGSSASSWSATRATGSTTSSRTSRAAATSRRRPRSAPRRTRAELLDTELPRRCPPRRGRRGRCRSGHDGGRRRRGRCRARPPGSAGLRGAPAWLPGRRRPRGLGLRLRGRSRAPARAS